MLAAVFSSVDVYILKRVVVQCHFEKRAEKKKFTKIDSKVSGRKIKERNFTKSVLKKSIKKLEITTTSRRE